MKRAPLVLSATVAGVAATVGFHARTATAPASAAPTASTTASGASAATRAAAEAPAGSSSATRAAAEAPAGSSSATASTPAATKTATTKTVTSDVVANQYGDVQLKVTVKNGRITDVTALQLPSGDPKSAEINAYAAPILRQSTLTAQSADVDSVSGATFTSDSYKTALQSALDRVTLAGSASSS